MAVSQSVTERMTRASWIRRMFEKGNELKARFGAENIFDFTLGNPDLEPPAAFHETLRALAAAPPGGWHRYMTNKGYLETRARVAAILRDETGVAVDPAHIVMTVGAAGAMNVIMKSLLDPGSEVIVLAPYFAEYEFYIGNHGGCMVPVKTHADFSLDVPAIAAALTERTRAVIVNTPNNPTGRAYGLESLQALAACLEGRDISIVSDEPYKRIIFDGVRHVSPLEVFPRTIVVNSHSKDLGLPGERIGYLAIHPEHPDRQPLCDAATFTNRTLGFVNAPAFMQRLVASLPADARVDIDVYRRRRDAMLALLEEAGYQCVHPEGTFYLFPSSPIADDHAFINRLQEHRILAVPGRGFGTPGYFRLSLTVPIEVIERSREGFVRARAEVLAG
jgi:aspartate aminotransferase